MRSIKAVTAAVLMLASASVYAHGVRFGFAFGFPFYAAPWYYAPPAYYYPPPVYTVPAPLYIEPPQVAAPAQTQTQTAHYWYYCPDSKTYYPYVTQCASAWQRVLPRPPGT